MIKPISPGSWQKRVTGLRDTARRLVGAATGPHGNTAQTAGYVEYLAQDSRLMSSCRELRANLAFAVRNRSASDVPVTSEKNGLEGVFSRAESTGAPGLLVASARNASESVDTVLALALSMAEVAPGATLLVDADLRNPVLHERLGLARAPGLTDILEAECEGTAAIRQVGYGLSILTSGAHHPAPPDTLLSRECAAGCVENLAASYPHLVFTSPSCLQFPDAALLAPLVGSVIMLVLVGRDTLEDIKHCKARLAEAGGALCGFAAVLKR